MRATFFGGLAAHRSPMAEMVAVGRRAAELPASRSAATSSNCTDALARCARGANPAGAPPSICAPLRLRVPDSRDVRLRSLRMALRRRLALLRRPSAQGRKCRKPIVAIKCARTRDSRPLAAAVAAASLPPPSAAAAARLRRSDHPRSRRRRRSLNARGGVPPRAPRRQEAGRVPRAAARRRVRDARRRVRVDVPLRRRGAVRAAAARDVLFLIADDLRPELNASYGQRHVATPHLDALARESLTFDNAYSQIALCAHVAPLDLLRARALLDGVVPHAGRRARAALRRRIGRGVDVAAVAPQTLGLARVGPRQALPRRRPRRLRRRRLLGGAADADDEAYAYDNCPHVGTSARGARRTGTTRPSSTIGSPPQPSRRSTTPTPSRPPTPPPAGRRAPSSSAPASRQPRARPVQRRSGCGARTRTACAGGDGGERRRAAARVPGVELLRRADWLQRGTAHVERRAALRRRRRARGACLRGWSSGRAPTGPELCAAYARRAPATSSSASRRGASSAVSTPLGRTPSTLVSEGRRRRRLPPRREFMATASHLVDEASNWERRASACR